MSVKNGSCPKCAASDVYREADAPAFGRPAFRHIPISAAVSVQVEHYVCGGCGYVETYVTNRADLRRIADAWFRVSRSPKPLARTNDLPIAAGSNGGPVGPLPVPAEADGSVEC